MFITNANVEEVIKWFHEANHEQQVLCIVIALSTEDRAKYSQLIDEFYQTDTALGEKIALLVFHPEAQTLLQLNHSGAHAKQLKADIFPRQSTLFIEPLRNTGLFQDITRGGESSREIFRGEASSNMARIGSDLASHLKISYTDCPALCVLVRGVEEIVVNPLPPNWTAEQLREKLNAVQMLLHRLLDNAIYIPPSRYLRQNIADLENCLRNRDAEENKLHSSLERLLNKCSASTADREKFLSFISASDKSENRVINFINNLDFAEDPTQLPAPLVKKCITHARRWEC